MPHTKLNDEAENATVSGPLLIPADQNCTRAQVVPHGAVPKSRPPKESGDARARTVLFGALAAGLLCWVGFYNGYPIVTPDSGNYLRSAAFHVALWPYRAPGYGSFMNWTSLGTSTWLTIAVQAFIVVYVLGETIAGLISSDARYIDRCLLFGALVLTGLTSLPWLASELMPDVFAGTLFLSAFLLAFVGEMGTGKRIVLALIMTISVAVHASMIPIAVLYVGALIILRFGDRRADKRLSTRPLLAWLLIPILTAGFWTATQNHMMGLGFRISSSGNYFLLGRLFGNGMAGDFLRENCPKQPLVSCRYLTHLPRDETDFLFWHPLRPELDGHEDEVKSIVYGAILANPGRFVISSAKQTMLQLVTLRTGEHTRLNILSDYWYDVVRVIPKDSGRYKLSRQFNDRLFPVLGAFTPIHVTAFWLSLVGCLLFAWTGHLPHVSRLFAAAAAFLVINAAVCGAFSAVSDRYQSRVEWIMSFCLIAYLCSFVRNPRFKERLKMHVARIMPETSDHP